MDVTQVLQNISEKQKKISAITDIERNIVFDTGSLTAWDPEAITMPKAGSKREEYFKKLARDDVQVVLNKLYSMNDVEIVEGKQVLKLPESSIVMPRAKPVPTPKPPTKWERFAREKGIKSNSSKTREKKIWDDETKRWVPRYGYERAKNEHEKTWVTEVKDHHNNNHNGGGRFN